MPDFSGAAHIDPKDLPEAYTDLAVGQNSTGPLTERIEVDHVVIGAGITGNSAALHLAQAGHTVAQLEAGDLSCGGSGRAFGLVVPYGKHGEARILKHFGPKLGGRHITALSEGPDLVRSLIADHNIQDVRHGDNWVLAPHAKSAEAELRKRATYWQERGGNVELLTGQALHDTLGSDHYDLALKDNRALTINPYNYALGLAGAARDAGVMQYTQSPAVNFEKKADHWEVQTPSGRVTARRLLLCTNAYSGTLSSPMERAYIRIRGHQAVTNPVSDNVYASILPRTGAVTDTRYTWSGIKKLPGNRLHLSAGGPTLNGNSPADLRTVTRRLHEMYPQIAGIGWQSDWSGWVAMTPDQFPRISRLGDGAWAGYGHNGRGLAGATLMGREMARIATDDKGHEPYLPVSDIRALPFHFFGGFAASAAINWYRLNDALALRKR